MDPTIHRVNVVQVELDVHEAPMGPRLIERVSRLRETRLPRLLDQVFDELSPPGRHDRLDVLTIDLGVIGAADFEEDFLRGLLTALRAGLARRLPRAAGKDAAQVDDPPGLPQRSMGPTPDRPTTGPPSRRRWSTASAELLEIFARTGVLPWWAERRADEVRDHTRSLLLKAPGEWRAVLHAVRGDSAALDRLARHLPEELPADLAPLAAELRDLSRRMYEASGVACDLPVATALLHRLAADPSGAPTLGEVLAGLLAGWEEAEAALDRVAAGADDLAAAVRSCLAGRRAVDALDGSPSSGGAASGAPRGVVTESDAASRDSRGQVSTGREEPRSPGSPQGPLAIRHGGAVPSARMSAEAQADTLGALGEIYLEDAGLVLLWPFLQRFLERLQLLDEASHFVSNQARIAGIAAVAALARGGDPVPEFLLPLPKLLCGISPDGLVQLDEPPSLDALREGERVLAAAIAHAGVLRDVRTTAFRRAYVVRPGALTIRDGIWLLRVERRPEDLVLARFPWAWGWVRLPWMSGPLQVEW